MWIVSNVKDQSACRVLLLLLRVFLHSNYVINWFTNALRFGTCVLRSRENQYVGSTLSKLIYFFTLTSKATLNELPGVAGRNPKRAFCAQNRETLQAVKDSRLCPWPLWRVDAVDFSSSGASKAKLAWGWSCLHQGMPEQGTINSVWFKGKINFTGKWFYDGISLCPLGDMKLIPRKCYWI